MMPNINKNQMCKHIAAGKICQFGNKCFFAHSANELEPTKDDASIICRYFASGFCQNGANCKFAHVEQQRIFAESKQYTMNQYIMNQQFMQEQEQFNFKMEAELKSKENARECKELGNKEFRIQNYIKAIEFYSKAISFDANSAPIYGNRAACYLQLQKYQQCINDCNKCIKINPDFTKAYLRRARSSIMLGNLSQSLLDLSKAKQLDPQDKSIEAEYVKAEEIERNLNKMQDEYKKENFNEAITLLNQILIQVPDQRIMQCIQIECLSRIGALNKASKIINKIQQEMQYNLDFLYARGIYTLYNNQLEKAKQYLHIGCKRDPDHSSRITYQKFKKINQGDQYLRKGKYNEAIQNYQEALEVDSSNKILNAILYANKAAALVKQKKFKEALEECNKSIEANEKYWKSYFQRAEIKMELQQFEEAIYDYNKTKQLNPRKNIQGRLHQAKESARKANSKDYYTILGVDRNATEDQIRKAYKKLALKWHPDKHQEEDKEEAQKMFRDISEAHSILIDKRRSMFSSGGRGGNKN